MVETFMYDDFNSYIKIYLNTFFIYYIKFLT